MKILCTICARNGSKSLPNKNFNKLKGKPLICHTIEQAIESKLYDKIVLSSDNKRIFNIGKKYKIDVWYLRPKKLSGDKIGKIPVIKHALIESEKYFKTKFDIIHDLDVTSPLRMVSDIVKAHKSFLNKKSNNLISGCLARKNPYFNMIQIDNKKKISVVKKSTGILRRQDAPIVYEANASIYIWKRKTLINNTKLINSKTAFYKMPQDRSIDIDSKFEWKIVEYLINNRKNSEV